MNETNDLQRWAKAWDVAEKRLERMRFERLRSMTDAQARQAIKHIFSEPTPPRVERKSGLVEQQRLFRTLA